MDDKKGVHMKQFLKSMLCAAILLTPAIASARNSDFFCSDDCNFSNDCSFDCSDTCSTTCSDKCSISCSDSCSFDCSSDCGRGYVNFRSQGANTARQLVTWQDFVHRFDMGNYGVLSLTYEYTRSFKSNRIARQLFGADRLYFQGSSITGAARNPNALVADYFGLPNTFNGFASFRPQITNSIIEIDGFFGRDGNPCWNGYWFEFHAPIVHTKWDLGLNACGDNVITSSVFGPCQLAQNSVPTAASVNDALSGNFEVNGVNLLCSGLFPTCRKTKTRLSNLELILGYDFINDECRHFGIGVDLIIPTGNKANGEYIFAPVVGNGQHAELGAWFTGHQVLWQDQCDQQLSFWFQGNITHMFRNRQCRVLDFCRNGKFSRYNLLREFAADGVTPTGNLVSATCFNRREVDVRIDVKGDFSFKLAYRWCNWGLDLGYNIYGHSREKVEWRQDCRPCDSDTRKLGIAGTNGVCCTPYEIADTGACVTITSATPASATTNLINATFANTANAYSPTTPNQADNYVPVSASAATVCLLTGVVPVVGEVVESPSNLATCTPTILANRDIAPVSSYPVLVNRNDLDPRSAAACAVLTNKVFANINYTWADDCGWNPTLGVGGEGEFASCRSNRTGLNQWGVWVKGVVTY